MSTREDWMRRLGPLYGGAVALVHSTPWRWPDTLAPGDTTGLDARSPFWMIAIGVPIGLVAWLVASGLHAIELPAPLAALAGLAVLTFASAAIVERGVVERIDGRDGSAPSVLAILVLVFGTLLRAAAIVFVPPTLWFGVFLATALVGRWAAVFLQALGDPIADEDTSRSLVVAPAPAWLTAAISLGIAIVVGLVLGKAGVGALVLAAAVTFGLGLDAQRRQHGLSVPVVATTAAIAELVMLLVATM